MTAPQILFYAIAALLIMVSVMVIILSFNVPNDNFARNTGYALIISTVINTVMYLFAEIPSTFYEAQRFYEATIIKGVMLTFVTEVIFLVIVTPIQNLINKTIENFINRITYGKDKFYVDLRLKILEKCGDNSITWGLRNLSKTKTIQANASFLENRASE